MLSVLKHPNVIGLHDVLYLFYLSFISITDFTLFIFNSSTLKRYLDATDVIVVGNPMSSFGTAKKIFLVVDLAGNGELFDYIIRKKKLPEEEARWFFRQILSAIERIFYLFIYLFCLFLIFYIILFF